MIWKKIAKVVLYVNLGFGVLGSISMTIAVARIGDYFNGSAGLAAFVTFLLGLVITAVNCCVLGTICEIADKVEAYTGTAPRTAQVQPVKPIPRAVPVSAPVQPKQDMPEDINATVVLPKSAFEKMGLDVDKKAHDGVASNPVAICKNCGTKNQVGSVFCYTCGSKL